MVDSTRYLPRHADQLISASLDSVPIVMIDGPRGAGKTTTAARYSNSQVFLPTDAEQLNDDAQRWLGQLEPPVLVDEWQLAGTDLLWTIKRIVDLDPTPGRFILTGSVEAATYGPTYPLTGRATSVALRPMTRAELDGNGAAPTWLRAFYDGTLDMAAVQKFDRNELTTTGFPLASHLPDQSFYLESYASLVAQRAGDEGRDANRLIRTLTTLATLTSQAVPDQRIWESADINKASWKAYEDLLLRTWLYTPSPSFETNALKRITSYPKRYLADTAMAVALAGLDAQQLNDQPKVAGAFFESYVAQQLRPQVDLMRGRLSHLRTASGEREVDLIIEFGTDVLALEVKLGTRPTIADAAHLIWLREHLGDRFKHGAVIHTGTHQFRLDRSIWAVPITSITHRR